MNDDFNVLLKPYGSVFSKPQFNHFCGLVKPLCICEIPSLNRISALHNKSRSSLNRFLTESTWKTKDVKKVYHQELIPYIKPKAFLIIDDTLSHRPYAQKVEKANWHFDHTINKQSLGYCLVTSVISSEEEIIPYDLESYYRDEDCKDRIFKSKNDIAKEIILSTKNVDNINTVIFDTWYSNDKVVGACKEAGKNYITQIKSNRNVTINYKKNAVRSFDSYIKNEDWSHFEHKDDKFRFISTSAFISGIGSVHLIFSQMYNGATKKWGETCYLISNLIQVNSQLLIENYLLRGGIEGFHREAKQNTGLEGYFLRNNRGIERYLFLVMLAYATLVLQRLSMESKATIGEMCERNKVAVYETVFEMIRGDPMIKDNVFAGLAKARV